MRHRVAGHKLGRDTEHRLSLLQNLTVQLVRYERISTTEAKAKAVRGLAEKVITKAKRGTLHDRRLVLAQLTDKETVRKLFEELGPRYKERNGGFTRVLKLMPRKGDAAPMALIELVTA